MKNKKILRILKELVDDAVELAKPTIDNDAMTIELPDPFMMARRDIACAIYGRFEQEIKAEIEHRK